MSKHRLVLHVTAAAVMFVLVVTACGPAATPVPQPTPTSAAEETPTAPAVTTPTAAPEIPRGGSVVWCYWEDLGPNLNPYRVGVMHYWQGPALNRLITWDPDGNPVPSLAAEVPTMENGGVSEDGKTITYHLREGVKWADGEPFTCDDVKFTIEGVKNPENQVMSRAGYELIDTVECPDPLTAIVQYEEFYAPWITIPMWVVPKHLLEEYPNWNDAPWATNLIGTGPFYVTENVSADHVTFKANPHYWVEGQPYIDEWIIKYVASREAGIALFEAGDCDIYWGLSEAEVPDAQNIPGVQLYSAPTNLSDRIYFNLSVATGPNHGNPDYPHPILGDVQVRRAIELAIDKQTIVDTFLHGLTTVATTDHPYGFWADPTIEPSRYDPDEAEALLQEAGWIDQDGDGVRECHGCLNAEEGYKLEISYTTPAGNKVREVIGSFIKEQLGDVGILMQFETQTATQQWGTYEEGGLGSTGQFDIQSWAQLSPIDPLEMLNLQFHSSQIPLSATECGNCINYDRFRNAEFDQLCDEAAAEPDPSKRKELFSRMYRIIQEEVPVIYMYNRGTFAIIQPYVKGWLGPWDTEPVFEYLPSYAGYIYLER